MRYRRVGVKAISSWSFVLVEGTSICYNQVADGDYIQYFQGISYLFAEQSRKLDRGASETYQKRGQTT